MFLKLFSEFPLPKYSKHSFRDPAVEQVIPGARLAISTTCFPGFNALSLPHFSVGLTPF